MFIYPLSGLTGLTGLIGFNGLRGINGLTGVEVGLYFSLFLASLTIFFIALRIGTGLISGCPSSHPQCSLIFFNLYTSLNFLYLNQFKQYGIYLPQFFVAKKLARLNSIRSTSLTASPPVDQAAT